MVGLRRGLRHPVGLWKRWREPLLASQLKHQLAVCAIFREEALFLDEWLAFHVGVGVTHFYLYNNFSTDDFRTVLQPWQAAGYITLTEWPIVHGQVAAYQDCLRRFKNEACWIAFIDVDEFLFSPRSPDVRPVLAAYAHLPGIEVWHVFFGANAHDRRPPTPVTESYTRCGSPAQTTVKSIVNPRLVYKVAVHQFKYWIGRGRDTSLQVAGPSVTPVLDVLRINHYWSRSFEDMEAKYHRGDSASVVRRDYPWYLARERQMNHQDDFVIQPIARAIRHPLTGKTAP